MRNLVSILKKIPNKILKLILTISTHLIVGISVLYGQKPGAVSDFTYLKDEPQAYMEHFIFASFIDIEDRFVNLRTSFKQKTNFDLHLYFMVVRSSKGLGYDYNTEKIAKKHYSKNKSKAATIEVTFFYEPQNLYYYYRIGDDVPNKIQLISCDANALNGAIISNENLEWIKASMDKQMPVNKSYVRAMDASNDLYAAIKYVVDNLPASLKGNSADNMGGETLKSTLKTIKEQVAKDKLITVHLPDAGKWAKELNGENIKLDNTTYEKIRFKNFCQKEPSYSDLKNYKSTLYADKKAASIDFYNKDSPKDVLFNLTVFDAKYDQKIESLKKYLFGEENSFYDDPVDNPEIAPTSYGGNKKTGMYGCTRLNTKTSNFTKPCNDEKVGNFYKRFHGGLDIEIISGVTELKAVIEGTVVTHDIDDGDLGKWVQITGTSKENKVIKYLYGHLNSILVKNGANVKKGEIIGVGGETGNAVNVDVKHCHLQIKIDGNSIDPNGYFKTKFDVNGNKID
jgi:murein DD-endopeptidase MepM/ murein hydrolase activator NlpD